jgi:hypothetical protein
VYEAKFLNVDAVAEQIKKALNLLRFFKYLKTFRTNWFLDFVHRPEI